VHLDSLMSVIEEKLRAGVPQTRIARALGVHRNTIHNWLRKQKLKQSAAEDKGNQGDATK